MGNMDRKRYYGSERPKPSELDIEILEKARYLGQQYIQNRFQRSRVELRLTMPRTKYQCSQDLTDFLCATGELLELNFPSLYNNVVDQLNFHISMEIVVLEMFTRVAEQLFKDGITWAKIISLFAFAGALSLDCAQRGQPRTAVNMSSWLSHFTHKRLLKWIKQEGGWESMTHNFTGERKQILELLRFPRGPMSDSFITVQVCLLVIFLVAVIYYVF